MRKNKNINEELLKVPIDMVMDIFQVIVKENLKHEIIQAVETRSIVVIAIYDEKNLPRHQTIIENLRNLLTEYNDFRWSVNEELNWREG